MKGVQLWQHPYVDVFKYISIYDWRQASKEGDVSEVVDKTLGKKVIKLQGSVSASNYIQIPRPKTELKTLGLNGKFIYIMLQVPPGKLFSIHLDFIGTNSRTNIEEALKVSLSNLFKENKLQNSLQVSCKIAAKWTVLCVDAKGLIGDYFGEKLAHKELKGIMLCANMSVRGVYTSDVFYSPKTLPKEIALKCGKIEEWGKFYDWVMVPEKIIDENIEEVRSSSLNKEREYNKVDYLDKKKSAEKIGVRKKPEKYKELTEEKETKQAGEIEEKTSQKTGKNRKIEQKHSSETTAKTNEKRVNSKPAKTLKNTSEGTPATGLNEKALLPDPILSLSNMLLVTPHPYNILWVPADYFSSYPSNFAESANKFLFYCSNSTIIAVNPVNLQKYFFFAHKSQVVFLTLHQSLLVSADKSNLVLFWPLKSRKKPIPLSLKKFKDLTFLSFFNTKLVISGKDELNRDCLVLYDTSKLVKKRELVLISNQLSDFELRVAKFYEEGKFVSCGKEGIRIWNFKDDKLASLGLGSVPRDQVSCTDLDIYEKKAYVVNNKSSVIIVNLTTKEVEKCLNLNSQDLTRIQILAGIVMTCSGDSFARFWPIDFKEIYMEVQHKTKVVSLDMLGTNAATLTESGVLISIDLANSTLTPLVKSYPNAIAFCFSHTYFSVVDSSVQLLSASLESICEFSAPNEDPATCAVSSQALACGFYSGAIRIFNIDSTKLIDTFFHLKSQIEVLSFSPDGSVLVAISEDGTYSIFDGSNGYQPVKDGKIEVPCNFSVDFSADSQYFAMISHSNMSVSIFQTNPVCQKFKINTTNPFIDAKFGGDVLLALFSNQMNYYSLEEKIVNFKQVSVPFPLTKFQVSPNQKYIAAASPDFSIKICDFFFLYPCQTFLGHSSEIKQITWKSNQIVSLSEKDGIFFWDFKGDLAKNLELGEKFEAEELEEFSQESEEPLQVDVEHEVEEYLRHVDELTTNMLLPSSPSLSYLFGYSPSQNNLFWSQEKSFLVYTLGSIIIKTLLVGEKKQVLMQGHYDKITVAALSPDQNFLATAEGLASFSGVSKVLVWNLETSQVSKVLEFHEKTVTCLQFSPCGNYLCSIGSEAETTLVIWEIMLSRPVATSILPAPALAVKWLPETSLLEFVTLCSNSITFWRLSSQKNLEFQPGETSKETMTCIEYSPYIVDLASYLLLIGTDKGSIVVSNARTNTLIMTKQIISGKINLIMSRSKKVIICGESAEVYVWSWEDGLFAGNCNKVLCDGVPISLSFNQEGNEGIVSTHNASIWYVEWVNGCVRVLNSHSRDITCMATGEMIATASFDCTIRVWNIETSEQTSHIFVPNLICTCLAFHRTFPYLIAGFSDGSLKLFEIYSNKCLGSTRSLFSKITCFCFTPENDNFIIGSENGAILMVVVSKWTPFVIDYFEFCNLAKEILSVDCKSQCLSSTTADGLVNVWEKKFTGENKPFDKTEFNLIDFLDFKEPYERTKHVIPQAESLECKAKFDMTSNKILWIILRGAQYLIQRNFSSHQVIKKINLGGFPLCLDVFERRIAVGLADRRVVVYSDGNIHEYLSHSLPVACLSLFNRGLATVSSNEIGYWLV